MFNGILLPLMARKVSGPTSLRIGALEVGEGGFPFNLAELFTLICSVSFEERLTKDGDVALSATSSLKSIEF